MKILVIENDPVLAGKIESLLKTEGHRCEIYPSPVQAMTSVAANYYDAIIFNLSTLDEQELELLRLLKSSNLNKKTLLTFEQNNVVNQNKVDSLDMANLPKPYALHAIPAKINALINYEGLEDKGTIFFNELVVDMPGRTVRVKSNELNLTRLEYDLLVYFVMNKSKVLSKNTLARYLTKDTIADPSDFGFLYAHIKNLKKKLKAAGCNDYIKTVYGIGYRFSL
ncbi:MAG TPA: winged helix-turn-helix domain-containing protein [Niastella sp.]